MNSVGLKFPTFLKSVGVALAVGLASCSNNEVSPQEAQTAAELSVSQSGDDKCSELLAMLERGDIHSIRLSGVPSDVKMLKSGDVSKYNEENSGNIFYRVYKCKADADKNIVTVGDGCTGKHYIQLANGEKAFLDDYISKEMADSLKSRAIHLSDSILESRIDSTAYANLRQYERDAILAYMYNTGSNILINPTKKGTKSFFNCLSDGEKAMVQSKFNVEATDSSGKSGLAKRNLIQMIIFGNGKIYDEKCAEDNFNKQLELLKTHKNSNGLIDEVIDIVERYGVDSDDLKVTAEKMRNYMSKLSEKVS